QFCKFSQLFPVRLDDEERLLHALVRGAFTVRGNSHHASARLQYCPGSFACLATHTVEYDVDLLDLLLEASSLVVNHFICPKPVHEFRVARRSRGNHINDMK